MNETQEKTRKKIFLEIISTVVIPVLSGLSFLFWVYSLIQSQPPKILIFPLSAIILVVLYFFSGNIYSGVLLWLLTVIGFLSVVLTSSYLYKLIFSLETVWLWGLFLLLEKYKNTFEKEKNISYEQIEDAETNISFLENKIAANDKRCVDLTERIKSYSSLGNMVSLLSSTVEEEKVLEILSRSTAALVGKGEWKIKKGVQNDIFAHYSKNHKLPIIVQNLSRDTRFYSKNAKYLSVIVMPIEINGKFWGIIKGVSDKPDIFDENDLRYLSVLSGIAGIALNNVRLYHKIQELAITDSLTGLYVHNYFKERLSNEIKRSRIHNLPLTVAILDVDYFKDFNDKYGHLCGDIVLRHIAAILRKRLRETDFISRYGGEEFGVIMLQTDIDEAKKVIDEIRQFIDKERFFLPVESFQPVFSHITVSAGISVLKDGIMNEEELLLKADSAMYRAKKLGRNCVELN